MKIKHQPSGYGCHGGKRKRDVLFLPPFILIKHDGSTQIFYNLSDIPHANKIADYSTWEEFYYDHVKHRHITKVYKNEYICRDDLGQIITQQDVLEAIRLANPHMNVDLRLQAEERGLPIPYTGSRSHSRRRWLGRIRNVLYMSYRREEAKAVEDDCADYKIKGKIRVPYFDWDGKPRASHSDRTWKKYRRKQWKE